ncbi:hypothetical protein GCM10009727_20890 [Actinomadura napierensis]|uniref:Uncharacterized protein n=1 Tax=Actinomadura napierensis TaxID=267854 RepID=A0ABN2YLV6_9ACTN
MCGRSAAGSGAGTNPGRGSDARANPDADSGAEAYPEADMALSLLRTFPGPSFQTAEPPGDARWLVGSGSAR